MQRHTAKERKKEEKKDKRSADWQLFGMRDLRNREGANCKDCTLMFSGVRILSRSKSKITRETIEAYYTQRAGSESGSDTSVILYNAENAFLSKFLRLRCDEIFSSYISFFPLSRCAPALVWQYLSCVCVSEKTVVSQHCVHPSLLPFFGRVPFRRKKRASIKNTN